MAVLRALPAVDKLLADPRAAGLIAAYGRDTVTAAVRAALDAARERARAGEPIDPDPGALIDEVAQHLRRRFTPSLRPVINATGVIIHTNLGRAPLSAAAQAAILAAAAGYSTLEFDLKTGKRGSRLVHAEAVLREITGAEAALIVNNNAAALVLILTALARDREVIISRGQLVEIGGGFRIPEVMAQSGARLVEVGTTNRTRAADYERAITADTAALMRAHASNFKQIGFVESVPVDELARIAHRHHVLAIDDLGSGALLDTAAYGLDHEPTVGESLAAGMDVICFSGDKLLGGPQAGIIVGRKQYLDVLKRHPLMRAIRADKLTTAGLAATLDHYRRGDALTAIPVWRMIARPLDELRQQAEAWAAALAPLPAAVIPSESTVGGGSLPGATLPTACLALRPASPDDFLAALRAQDPPVIARIERDAALFDPRTVLPGQETELLAGIRRAWEAAQAARPPMKEE
jgi:L-seryl-tRNA(Ser) seleniumtransferase